ncbi:prolyl oligopeptidase [Cristinia sonorae]|uniref:Prolyl endopeptidase n=1 Tax=Cristinia sonorae TaxID=1940300 RepID=A0A8K0UHR5_9AGAR|nr:prolyl oligopeptidase [Cristinia sonorae]
MPAAPTPWTPNRYPATRRSDHVDVYKSEEKGEVSVPNPYNWLEQDSEETDKWVSAQEAFTREYLDQNPERVELEDAVRKSMDYAKFSAPTLKEDGRWYWYYNSGLQAQSVIYRSKDKTLPDVSGDGPGAGAEVFFDSNLLSSDGTSSLADTAFSRSGEYFTYAISHGGSDFSNVYVRPTSAPLAAVDGKKVSHDEGRLQDELKFVKFTSLTWTHDNKGFFYQRFPAKEGAETTGIQTGSDTNAMLYYHRIGTPQSEDILVVKDDANPTYMFGTEISEIDGRYLLLTISRDTSRKYLLWIADLEKEAIGQNLQWDKIVDTFEAKYEYVANDGPLFYFRTNHNAPQFKFVSVDISLPASERVFKEIIPEDKDAFLEDVLAINGNTLIVLYKRNVKDELYLYSFSGTRLTRLAPDFVGAIHVSGRRDKDHFFSTLTGFTSPGTVALYDFKKSLTAGEKQVDGLADHSERWSVYRTTKVKGLDLDQFEASQVWYSSTDGTKVPMFVVRQKSTPFDGTAPAIQYGYGGFTISIDPFFSPAMLTFLQKYGAILAVPNIRGGGEFGEDWHQAAIREKKKNSYDDFISATKFLIDNKYAAPGKVALNGGSNGGLLVGACIERAPEGLIGAAVADVGVHDLLKFADFTIGRAWTSDYGDPHDPHDFDFIYKISPVHNVPKDKVLPPTILLTADHDDRVVPLHSFKFAATLQHTLPHNPNPLLLRVDKKAGHGAGKSTDQRIKEAADKWGFVAQSLGLKARS